MQKEYKFRGRDLQKKKFGVCGLVVQKDVDYFRFC